ncbi:MAG: hypothetical protein Q8N14_06850 [Candidatus Omnitrophota bacterium]|nr:hypothetical protein [Candidatus Omnitrophota bacterium]
MRELLYKNLTSLEKGRRILAISEESQKNGFLTRTSRKFIYMIKDTENLRESLTAPVFHIFKIRDSKNRKERFVFKVKGNFFVVNDQKVRLVYFCHSFKIDLSQLPVNSQQNPVTH